MTTALPVCPTDPSAPPSSSITAGPTSPSAAATPPKDVPREIQKEIRNLQSEDEITIMKAAASIVMLSTLPEAEAHLGSCVSRLISLLNSAYSVHVKRNACAALTAVMNTNLMLYLSVLETQNLMAGFMEILKCSEDSGLLINALAGLSILAQQDQGLALIAEAEVENNILSLLESAVDPKLEEEAADTICALAYHEQMRPKLLQKGAVSKLASCLKTNSAELCVRVLLALGMICGSSVDGQLELVKGDGIVKDLVTLMRSSDHDIKFISRDLFATLTSNQQARTLVEQVMRNL